MARFWCQRFQYGSAFGHGFWCNVAIQYVTKCLRCKCHGFYALPQISSMLPGRGRYAACKLGISSDAGPCLCCFACTAHMHMRHQISSQSHHLDLQGSIAGFRPQFSGRATMLQGVRMWSGARVGSSRKAKAVGTRSSATVCKGGPANLMALSRGMYL
jgi:hypothetical protein